MDVERSPVPGERARVILSYPVTRRKQFHFVIGADGASLFCTQNSAAVFDFLDAHEIYELDIDTGERLYSASFFRKPSAE